MFNIIVKALTLFSVVILGFTLKQFKAFSGRENFEVVSRIVMYVTLPAAIVTNLNGTPFEWSLLLISGFGFLCNWLYILVSYVFGRDREEQSFLTLNINGYNIGNFALPFISYFVQGTPILYVSLFDAGSALMVLSGNYTVASVLKSGESQGLQWQDVLKRFLSSPAVLAYIVMITLSLFSLSLPGPIAEFVGIIGGANTFLSMLMIGLALDLQIDTSQLKNLARILGLRYGLAALIALAVYFFMPVDLVIKKTLIIILFAPVASAAPMFTHFLDGDLELSAQVNSLSIIISMVFISGILMI